jgi:hypothetical protein
MFPHERDGILISIADSYRSITMMAAHTTSSTDDPLLSFVPDHYWPNAEAMFNYYLYL